MSGEHGTTLTVGRKSIEAMAEASWGKIDRSLKADVIPPGWRSVMQKAAEWGISRDAAEGRLGRLLAKGFLEKREFNVRDGHGCLRRTTHFLPVKSTKRR